MPITPKFNKSNIKAPVVKPFSHIVFHPILISSYREHNVIFPILPIMIIKRKIATIIDRFFDSPNHNNHKRKYDAYFYLNKALHYFKDEELIKELAFNKALWENITLNQLIAAITENDFAIKILSSIYEKNPKFISDILKPNLKNKEQNFDIALENQLQKYMTQLDPFNHDIQTVFMLVKLGVNLNKHHNGFIPLLNPLIIDEKDKTLAVYIAKNGANPYALVNNSEPTRIIDILSKGFESTKSIESAYELYIKKIYEKAMDEHQKSGWVR